MVRDDLVDNRDAESGTVVDGVRGAVVGNWDWSGCWCGRDRPGERGMPAKSTDACFWLFENLLREREEQKKK